MFAVTAAVVSAVRDTATTLLSVLPLAIVSDVVLSAMLPLVALIGRIIANGAPVGATALN